MIEVVIAFKRVVVSKLFFAYKQGYLQQAHTILNGKPEEESFLGRLEVRWKDNIKVDLPGT